MEDDFGFFTKYVQIPQWKGSLSQHPNFKSNSYSKRQWNWGKSIKRKKITSPV